MQAEGNEKIELQRLHIVQPRVGWKSARPILASNTEAITGDRDQTIERASKLTIKFSGPEEEILGQVILYFLRRESRCFLAKTLRV